MPVSVMEASSCLSMTPLRDRDACGGAKMGQRHFDDALVSRQHAIVPIAVFGNIHLFHIAVTSVVECLSLKVVQIEFRRRPSNTRKRGAKNRNFYVGSGIGGIRIREM